MATDPFVAPGLDDAPRQAQNLAPGVALPPAGRWEARRPGDLVGGQPQGTLLGRPGPNVGYALTLAHRVGDRLVRGPHEPLDDAVAVVGELAMRRAAAFRRAPVITDVEVASSVLGYDRAEDAELVGSRTAAVLGAHHDYARRRRLVDAVPDEALRDPGAQPDGDSLRELLAVAR
jgi:hypothetical protein